MKINYKESQIDFLSNTSGAHPNAAPARYMAAQVSLSLENLVILSIVAIMFVIFSFSMGIERGKRIAMTSSPDVFAGAVPASNKVEKASEKVETKDVADAPKPKGVVVSSQTVAKAVPNAAVTLPAAQLKAKAVVTPASGAYTLQVASYKGERFAQKEADKLKQKGFNNVYILPKGAYTIVCVGNFQKKEDASDVKRQLKGRYQDFVVRRL